MWSSRRRCALRFRLVVNTICGFCVCAQYACPIDTSIWHRVRVQNVNKAFDPRRMVFTVLFRAVGWTESWWYHICAVLFWMPLNRWFIFFFLSFWAALCARVRMSRFSLFGWNEMTEYYNIASSLFVIIQNVSRTVNAYLYVYIEVTEGRFSYIQRRTPHAPSQSLDLDQSPAVAVRSSP